MNRTLLTLSCFALAVSLVRAAERRLDLRPLPARAGTSASNKATFSVNGAVRKTVGYTGVDYALQMEPHRVHDLPPCAFVPPSSKTSFAGWTCSKNGKRYDDGMLVFNLAEPGETVTMTAIWE